jgi:hypothetical protein
MRSFTIGGAVALGIILIIIGAIFLLDSLGVIDDVSFGELWPILLIALGVMIVYDRLRRAWRRR